MSINKKISAIILGAGHNSSSTLSNTTPTSLIKDQYGETVLKWVLNALRKNKINNIRFVGGFEIQKIGFNFPDLDFIYNPVWHKTGVLESLYQARKYINGPIIISYGDIVFTDEVVKRLISNKDKDIVIAHEKKNLNHIYSGENVIKNVTVVENNNLIDIGFLKPTSKSTGEFIGVAYFNENSSRILRDFLDNSYQNFVDKPFGQSNNIQSAYLTDLLRFFIKKRISISCEDIGTDWIEIDNVDSLTKFVIGTKGDTLKKLKTMLKKSKLCNQYIFTVNEWEKNNKSIIKKIEENFPNQKLALRSSSTLEDSFSNSNAGAFESILDVSSIDEIEITNAVNKVISSYNNNQINHQVLVQNMVENVIMSGVVFTRDMETGAPYYVISYDNSTSRTDTVTSGSSNEIKTIMISKSYSKDKIPNEFKRLIRSIVEIEDITNYEALDIEFAINSSNEIYILQVRPIVSLSKKVDILSNDKTIGNLTKFLERKFSPTYSVFGKTTILADMPDWNPAEMIGTNPRPLAYSLYDYLITKKTWRLARSKIGYYNPRSIDLMYNICGYPYIDVRASFNNLTPSSLPENIFEKIINYYLTTLSNYPDKNDKVEFEILFTCLDFSFDKRSNDLLMNGFNSSEINILKKELLSLTDNIVTGKTYPIEQIKNSFQTIERNRNKILLNYKESKDVFLTIRLLLDNCIKYGTIPFAILARYAFIANSLLRSLAHEKIFSIERSNLFFNSISTIATKLLEDLDYCLKGKINREDFLDSYGHLRPGTYDINSKKYSENFENYFNVKNYKKLSKDYQNKSFKLDVNELNNINLALEKNNFSFSARDLLSFSESAISNREFGKFKFTKCISTIFDLLIDFGKKNNISRDDLSFIEIDDLLTLNNKFSSSKNINHLKKLINKNKTKFKKNELVHLPNIIFEEKDVNIVKFLKSRPNFVTQGKVSAKTVFLENNNKFVDLNGKIVLIEGADPGFDWIFTYKIKGLITKYGGSASHMTIRANEFNIPAAIGCGEQIFKKAKNSSIVELNCSEKYINVY